MLSPVLFQCVQSAWLDWRNNEDEEKVLYYSAVVKMSRSTPAHSPQGNTWTEMSWAKRKRKYLNEKENHHSFDPSQLESFIYLYILVDFVELDAVCPLKPIPNTVPVHLYDHLVRRSYKRMVAKLVGHLSSVWLKNDWRNSFFWRKKKPALLYNEGRW